MGRGFLTSSPVFAKNVRSLPPAQFSSKKGLGCTDALLAISHRLQLSIDAGMESYIVQLDFSFDTVSHSGLLFKLKSIFL